MVQCRLIMGVGGFHGLQRQILGLSNDLVEHYVVSASFLRLIELLVKRSLQFVCGHN